MPVKIKKLHQDAVLPKYAKELDAGFDLVAVEDVIIGPGESAKVSTGLAIALPLGYELQVRPRSGVSAKTKLRISNAPGTIDAGYRGEVCVLVDNTKPRSELPSLPLRIDGTITTTDSRYGERSYGTYLIRKGDHIAQGVLAKVPIAQFEVVDELDETERGTGGFGSTGTN
ncbi:deoxyuridine 5'-triphosphate nucleotidohydrolase [Brevibacillus choshinensis]|nr:deoxyuridine 5'-triphosphate nucleotidohydrolase [Brevibacillus choshinensis]